MGDKTGCPGNAVEAVSPNLIAIDGGLNNLSQLYTLLPRACGHTGIRARTYGDTA